MYLRLDQTEYTRFRANAVTWAKQAILLKTNTNQLNKPVFFFFLTCLFSLSMKAQVNLVPNGSFEEYDSCPSGWADFPVKHWFSPTLATPDYYNTCNLTGFSVPINPSGFQEANDGNAYVGFGAAYDSYNVAEYISIMLSENLTENVEYRFSCYISLADSSHYATNKFGVHFSNTKLNLSNANYLDLIPHIESNKTLFFKDTSYWMFIEGEYLATGEEKFMSLGFFTEPNISDTIKVSPDPFFDRIAYYFIDNVNLDSYYYEPPNVFSPNNDFINDVWIYPSSAYNELMVLNRWGEVVFNQILNSGIQPSWDGFDKFGNACIDGTYYFVLNKEQRKKTGFIQLVR